MVKLRLRRLGRKKLPIYKIVAADSRYPRDGRFIEAVGEYNPNHHPMTIELKEDRVMHWLNNGAQPTPTVKNLLSRKGILLEHHLRKKGASEETINSELEKFSGNFERKLRKAADKKLKLKEKKRAAKKSDGGSETAAAPEVPAGETQA